MFASERKLWDAAKLDMHGIQFPYKAKSRAIRSLRAGSLSVLFAWEKRGRGHDLGAGEKNGARKSHFSVLAPFFSPACKSRLRRRATPRITHCGPERHGSPHIALWAYSQARLFADKLCAINQHQTWVPRILLVQVWVEFERTILNLSLIVFKASCVFHIELKTPHTNVLEEYLEKEGFFLS